ncbi:MAG: peptide-methionine (S)-S-oxide reductase MsrA [Saprospiraceae bacterium]|nr:peptide-methionine (S)-S-oxide reductase MsrA [Saprospiraceae bacterium]
MNKQVATFGGGCFWCIEAIIQRIEGIESIESGYTGGHTLDPNYRSICSGTTGHAEVVQVHFDANRISYEDLITVFMTSHDPTTLNQQGADRGTQYRSIILYHDAVQKSTAEKVIQNVSNYYDKPIVTQLEKLEKYYPAEQYHQNYYNRNGQAGYCRVVIQPKISKLRKHYADKLKKEEV